MWRTIKGCYIEAMYDRIYIYEFEGNLKDRTAGLGGEDYVGFWKEGRFSFLFFKKEKKDQLQKMGLSHRSELVIRHEDWESGQALDILRLDPFVIHPPWKSPPSREGIRLCIDPKMAFGSGYHATTKSCLLLLDRLYREMIPERVLDLGTGTGILSIAALKMGAGKAVSIDYNHLSIDTARQNRRLNCVEGAMELLMGDARDFLNIEADLLIANMHFRVLDEITAQDIFYTKPYYLLSGLSGEEGPRLQEKLERRLFLLDRREDDSWFSYLLKNRNGRR